MAEKGFGVKEINLIGASGTPTIESPNNLNLNAVNVAISTNVSIGGTLTVSGNISVGGTLTYEDVTNIDSVGIVTAREGVFIPDNKELKIGNTAGSPDFSIKHDTNNTILDGNTGDIIIRADGDDLKLLAEDDIVLRDNDDSTNFIHCINGGKVILYHAGSQKFETNNTGAEVTGTLTATTFSGSGASLTNLPAANLTGTLPAISGANLTGIAVTEAPVTDYTITANGASAYRFHGGGVNETADNPDLYLVRGQKYRFNNTTGSGHPFAIREASGGSAYSNGVTGSQNGIQFFTVPYDAPAKIFYQCTIHGGMVGNIYIRGADGQNDNVGLTTFKDNVSIVKSTPILELSTNTAGNDASIRLHESTPGSTSNGGGMFYSGSDNKLHITCGTTLTTKRITVDRDTGRVGINEESPDSLLHLTTNSSTSYSTASSDINQTNSLLRLENANGGDGSGVDNYVGVYFRVANGANSDATLHYVRSGDNTGTFRFKARNAGSTYNELMAIDSSGSVNKPKNPAFYAWLSTNNAVYSAGTVVPWDNTHIDTRSAFQTSGSDQGKYIIPTTGIYYFGWRLNRRNDSRFDLAIYRNGSLRYIDEMRWEGTSGMWMAESGHYLMSCTAGQKIDLRIYQVQNAGSGQFDGGGNAYYDAFFGWMVG